MVATDVDRQKLAQLRGGHVPFYEPGLEELVRQGLATGRLRFTSEWVRVAQGPAVVFICVGTPPRETGEANLLAVERAAEMLARHATRPMVVVEKSTVPAGTATRIAETLARHNGKVEFAVVSNPEFLREGSAVEDSLHPSRILVGSDSPNALATMRELYAPLREAGSSWVETDVRTAELAKHACNAFLSMKISYANALARVCELAGADVLAVADAMGSDDRIGRSYLDAGLGYGGYCFPKDLEAFRRLAARLGYDFGLLEEVARINDQAVQWTFRKVQEVLWNLEEKRVALLGLAFKPGTDDTRLSPALALAEQLLRAGAVVVGYDPEAGGNAKSDVPDMDVVGDVYAALDGAHCAVICTGWEEFGRLDLPRARRIMAFPIVIDGRNILDREAMARERFTYLPTGRPPVRPWSAS